jgi:PHD/YefM family antitoxin component YafN of YafNO toxin-antitoxin module
MSHTIEHSYPQVEMTKVGQIIRKLHDQVVGQRRRVEITRAGYEDGCVMISKAELESLENALAIFANTQEFNEMCRSLKNLLDTAGVVYSQATTTISPLG